jgi:hypothetical protein
MGEHYEGEDRQGAAEEAGSTPLTTTEADITRRSAGDTAGTEEEDPDSGPSTGPAHPEDFSPDDFE